MLAPVEFASIAAFLIVHNEIIQQRKRKEATPTNSSWY
jgi:hypothetical protein